MNIIFCDERKFSFEEQMFSRGFSQKAQLDDIAYYILLILIVVVIFVWLARELTASG